MIPICDADQPCSPKINLEFARIDAAELQATLLGSEKKGSLFSSVISRITSSSGDRKWPAFEGTVKAESLVLGPVTLENASAEIKVNPAQAEVTAFDAELFGGQVHLTGKIENADKPVYSIEGQADGFEPVEFCRLFELKCTGRPVDATGKVQLTGFTDVDLGSSAKGSVHFDWKKGTVAGQGSETEQPIPASLIRFDDWAADAEIANNGVTIGENTVKTGARSAAVNAAIKFGDPPGITFGAPKAPMPGK